MTHIHLLQGYEGPLRVHGGKLRAPVQTQPTQRWARRQVQLN